MEVVPVSTERIRLKQVRVAERFGLIFINFDPSLRLRTMPAQVDAQLARTTSRRAKIAHRETYSVDANWKIALGNYLECYHCETGASRSTRACTRSRNASAWWPNSTARCGHARAGHRRARTSSKPSTACSARPPASAPASTPAATRCSGTSITGARTAKPVAPLMGDFKGYDGGAGDCQFGPLTYMLNYPDHCSCFATCRTRSTGRHGDRVVRARRCAGRRGLRRVSA
jgi:Rieske 2Fe-2S family protein